MELPFVGPMIRGMRLEKNWSLETLSGGICAVSYLSKIEQGRVIPNEQLIRDLMAKLDIRWETDPVKQRELLRFCDEQLDRVFSRENLSEEEIRRYWESSRFGVWYPDLMLLYAHCDKDYLIPAEMILLLNDRQKCLAALLADEPEKAHKCHPCPLTMLSIGQKAYSHGEYTLAVEYLQMAYDAACGEGLAHIMLASQIYLSNSYSDLRNRTVMERHMAIASRLARYLGQNWILRDLDYNRAATAMEMGDYEEGYGYFSSLAEPSGMELHKLAICCEQLGKPQEALDAITRAEQMFPEENSLRREMCALVRFRLENPGFLKEPAYGKMLMELFARLRRELPIGYARFHLYWMKEWLTANRQYRQAYELMLDFPG